MRVGAEQDVGVIPDNGNLGTEVLEHVDIGRNRMDLFHRALVSTGPPEGLAVPANDSR